MIGPRNSVALVLLVVQMVVVATVAKAARVDKSLAPKSNEPAKYGTIQCRLYDQQCHLDYEVSEAVNFDEARLNTTNARIFMCKRPHLEAIHEQANGSNKSNDVYYIQIVPVQVGRAQLVSYAPDGSRMLLAHVVITRPYRGIDVAFDVFLWVYVGLVSFVMGASINRDLINYILTGPRQKEVGLTFLCQSILMPLIALGVTKVFALKPFESLTLFIYGCCPSSFESTKWSEIFRGDVDLNKFSSFMSTLFTLITMPACLYTLGSGLMEAAEFRLPLPGLALNMVALICPALLGYVLAAFINDLRLIANIANKIIHSIIFIIIFLTLILTSRIYAFRLGNPLFILVGPMIAFIGYIIGASLAWLFGLPCEKIKSISLHTGFQNIVFAFLVVNWNYPSPEVDYILVCLVPVFLQTSLPIKIIFLVKKIRGCVKKRRAAASSGSTSGAANRAVKLEVDADKLPPEQEPIYDNRS